MNEVVLAYRQAVLDRFKQALKHWEALSENEEREYALPLLMQDLRVLALLMRMDMTEELYNQIKGLQPNVTDKTLHDLLAQLSEDVHNLVNQ